MLPSFSSKMRWDQHPHPALPSKHGFFSRSLSQTQKSHKNTFVACFFTGLGTNNGEPNTQWDAFARPDKSHVCFFWSDNNLCAHPCPWLLCINQCIGRVLSSFRGKNYVSIFSGQRWKHRASRTCLRLSGRVPNPGLWGTSFSSSLSLNALVQIYIRK